MSGVSSRLGLQPIVDTLNSLGNTVDSLENTVKKVGNTADSLGNTAEKVGNTVEKIGITVEKVVALSKDLVGKPEVAADISEVNSQIVDKLQNILGMTQSRGTKFKKATPIFKLKDGAILKTYKNSVGVDHVFLADTSGRMLFAGYVGWIHSDNLQATIAEIKRMFA